MTETKEATTLFKNPRNAAQLIDFSGMILSEGSTAYPTDVDGLIEWKNKTYLIIELKHGNASMKLGQSLAFTRLTDDLQTVKPTIFIVGRHDTPHPEMVDMASAIVVKYRYRGDWTYPENQTVRELVDWFISSVTEEKEEK